MAFITKKPYESLGGRNLSPSGDRERLRELKGKLARLNLILSYKDDISCIKNGLIVIN